MMRIKLSFVVLIFPLAASFGQSFWSDLNGPYGGTITDMVRHSSGAILVTTGNGIWRSANDGTSWAKLSTGTDISFSDLDVDASGNIYAVTLSKVYKSVDGGTSFQNLNSTGTPFNILKIKISTIGNIFLAGSDAKIYRSTNAGATFSVSSTDITSTITDMDIDGADRIYVATLGQGVRFSTNGGLNFNPPISGSIASNASIYSVVASPSAGTLYALASDGPHRSTNSGDTWVSIKGALADGSFSGVIDLSPGGSLFVFNNNSSQYFSTGNPTASPPSWSAGTSFPVLQPVKSALLQTASTFYLGFQRYGISKSTNTGTTWNFASAGLRAFDGNPRLYRTPGKRLLVGWEGVGFYFSIDDGVTFDLIASGNTNRLINGFVTLDDGSILGYGNGAIRSTDQGSNWSIQHASQGLPQVVTADNINLFSYSGTNLLTSVNQGVTWTSQAITGLPSPVKIQVDGSNNLYFLTGGSIYKVDAGTTTANLLTLPGFVNDFTVVNDRIYAIAPSTTLSISDNGGASFNTKTIPSSHKIWAYNDQNLFVHNNQTGAFNISPDGGNTWASQPVNDSQGRITDLLVSDDNFGYVVANNSVAYRSTNNFILPVAPGNLVVKGRTYNAVELLWDDNSDNEASWVVERSEGSNNSFAEVVTLGTFPNLQNKFRYTSAGAPGITYFYRVKAVNGAGSSAYSNEVNVTLLDQCPPAIPDNRSWTAVSIADPGSTPAGAGPFTSPNAVVKFFVGSANSYTISDYEMGVNGNFIEGFFDETCGQTFLAWDGLNHPNGNGAWNPGTGVLTLKWQSAPDAPFFQGTTTLTLNASDPVPATPGLAAYLFSGTEVLLNWSQTAFEQEYVLERATVSGGPYAEVAVVAYPSVSFVDKNLTTGQTYFYRIQARNAAGSSAFSPETSVNVQQVLFRPVENAISLNFENQQGISWGDLDGDGWEDIASPSFTNNAGQTVPPVFYKNLGATDPGQFERKDLSVLVNENIAISRGINLFDFNNDGKQDMYISRTGEQIPDLLLININNDWTFTKITVPGTSNFTTAFRSAAVIDYDKDGFADVFTGQDANDIPPTLRDLLYRNISGTTLGEVTTGNLVSDLGNTRNVNTVDFDNDGDQDIYVIAFDAVAPSARLYKNNGDGTFTRVNGLIFDTDFVTLVRTSSWGDIDNDGDMDLYVGSRSGSFAVADRLYRNNGDGTFTNLSGSAVAETGSTTFGSAFGDIDNDGDLDLIAVNAGANSIFRNDGTGNFTKYTGLELITHPDIFEIGIALADFDKDGFLDIYPSKGQTSVIDLPNLLYRNTLNPSSSRHWVQIKLNGTTSNKSGIGARIKVVTTSPNRTQIREVSARTGYGSTNSLLAHFGLGTATSIGQIEIKWPSGIVQTLNNINTIDQILIIDEDVEGPTFTLNPLSGSTAVPIGTSLGFTLNEAATPVAGKVITIRKGSASSPPIQTIDVATGTVSGNDYSYALTASTEFLTTYFISIEAGAFVDQFQNASLEVAASDWTFTTTEPPDVTFPVIAFDPNQYISFPKNFAAGEKISAIATDNKGIASFVMHHRKITATDFADLPGVLNGAVYDFPLLNTFFDEMGMEYFFEAKDAAGNTTREPATGLHQTRLAFDDINTTLSIAAGSGINNYQIRSVPYEGLSSNQVSVLFDELGQPDPKQYRFLRYQSNPEAWSEYPNGFNAINRGEGYFILSRAGANVKLGATLAPDNSQDNLFSLNLIQGWNLIGNPYTVTVSWNESKTGFADVGTLKVYNNGSYVDGNEMSIFEGGFVFANTPQVVPVKFKTSATGGRADTKTFSSALDKSEWMVPLHLEQEGYLFLLGGIGMHPDSKLSYDRYDDLAPPALEADRLEIQFEHMEHFMKKFSRDMIPTADEYTWEFTVLATKGGNSTLSWDPSSFGDNGKELMLYDLGLQRLIDMRKEGRHVFDPKVSTRFKIYFGENLMGKIKPLGISLGEPYPNPSQGQATIGFTLPENNGHYQVRLDVYDMTGKKVATLVNGILSAGFYTYPWIFNFGDTPSGLYTYRMAVATTGASEIKTRKIIVIK